MPIPEVNPSIFIRNHFFLSHLHHSDSQYTALQLCLTLAADHLAAT